MKPCIGTSKIWCGSRLAGSPLPLTKVVGSAAKAAMGKRRGGKGAGGETADLAAATSVGMRLIARPRRGGRDDGG